jgi:hypothetical protein
MKTSVYRILVISFSLFLANCAPNAGMGMSNMRMGQRSAAINDGRSRPEALTSSAQLSQNRKQRANELEEARVQRELRSHDRDAFLSPLKTASEALGAFGNIRGGFNRLTY